MPWGEMYIKPYTGRVLTRAAYTFGFRLAAFKAAAEKMGAVAVPYGDAGFEFAVLGNYKMRFLVRELKNEYPQIDYAVVLAYMPGKQTEYDDYSDTMLPEGIEFVHPRYAISWRNNWMLQQSDYVVTYITHSWGGAAQYADKARRQKKTVINISDG